MVMIVCRDKRSMHARALNRYSIDQRASELECLATTIQRVGVERDHHISRLVRLGRSDVNGPPVSHRVPFSAGIIRKRWPGRPGRILNFAPFMPGTRMHELHFQWGPRRQNRIPSILHCHPSSIIPRPVSRVTRLLFQIHEPILYVFLRGRNRTALCCWLRHTHTPAVLARPARMCGTRAGRRYTNEDRLVVKHAMFHG